MREEAPLEPQTLGAFKRLQGPPPVLQPVGEAAVDSIDVGVVDVEEDGVVDVAWARKRVSVLPMARDGRCKPTGVANQAHAALTRLASPAHRIRQWRHEKTCRRVYTSGIVSHFCSLKTPCVL
jgi:hypothetical protein